MSAITGILLAILSAEAPPAAPPPATPQVAPAPAPNPPAAATTAPAPAPAVAPAPAAAQAGPKELLAGLASTFKPYILAQGWFFYDRDAPAGCPPPYCDTFRVRRAEFGFTGSALAGAVQYRLTSDPARMLEFGERQVPVSGGAGTVAVRQPTSGSSLLNDFTLTFVSEFVEPTIGQFRIPVSWEGYNGSARMLFPERSIVARNFGDRRDLGLKLTKTFKYLSYGVFLLNGAGQNVLDNDLGKDVAVRLELHPYPGVTVGGVAYSSIGKRHRAGTKDRWEGDLRVEVGPYLLQAEFIRGRDRVSSAPDSLIIPSYGYYVALGYTFLELIQPALRFSHFDPRLGTLSASPLAPTVGANAEVDVFEAGVNLLLHKHEVKLQLAYGLFDWKGLPSEHQAIAAVQVAY